MLLVYSLVSLLSSIAMLRRKAAGRIAFMVVLGIAAVWSLSFPVVQYLVLRVVLESPHSPTFLEKSQFETLTTVVLIISSVALRTTRCAHG